MTDISLVVPLFSSGSSAGAKVGFKPEVMHDEILDIDTGTNLTAIHGTNQSGAQHGFRQWKQPGPPARLPPPAIWQAAATRPPCADPGRNQYDHLGTRNPV